MFALAGGPERSGAVNEHERQKDLRSRGICSAPRPNAKISGKRGAERSQDHETTSQAGAGEIRRVQSTKFSNSFWINSLVGS
jgi:hypothetical protein